MNNKTETETERIIRCQNIDRLSVIMMTEFYQEQKKNNCKVNTKAIESHNDLNKQRKKQLQHSKNDLFVAKKLNDEKEISRLNRLIAYLESNIYQA